MTLNGDNGDNGDNFGPLTREKFCCLSGISHTATGGNYRGYRGYRQKPLLGSTNPARPAHVAAAPATGAFNPGRATSDRLCAVSALPAACAPTSNQHVHDRSAHARARAPAVPTSQTALPQKQQLCRLSTRAKLCR